MAIGRISGQMLKSNLLRSGTDLAFETTLLVLDVTNSRVGVGTASPSVSLHVAGSDAIRVPTGNTAARPTGAVGMIRHNSTTGQIEGYNGAWVAMTGGSTLSDIDGNTGIDVERASDQNEIHFFTETYGDVAHIRDNGSFEINNLKIADMTISSLTTNGDINITPNGTGSTVIKRLSVTDGLDLGDLAALNVGAISVDSVQADDNDFDLALTDNRAAALEIKEGSNAYMTFVTTDSSEQITIDKKTVVSTGVTFESDTVDINGGAIDGAIIGAASAAAGTFTTATAANVQTGTVKANDGSASITLADSTGIPTFSTNINAGENNIINVGDIALDSISSDGTAINVALDDNQAGAFTIKEGSNAYVTVDTTNSSELVTISEALTVATGKTFTTDTADINGGAIDGATIGANSAAAGTFTTATATTAVATNAQVTNIKANDGTAAMTIADSSGAVKITTAFEVDGAGFIFNESSASVDFRVESNGHAHALFVDGSEDHVGIKTATPAYDLDVSGSTDALRLPNGTTGERPTGATGIIRFNTTTGLYEGCSDGSTFINFAIAGDAPTFTKESTTGDGSTTTFTGFFSSAPESANNVFVYIDNVYQEPTENYSVSSTNITFTSAPHSGARIFAITGADGTSLVTGGVSRSETSSVNFTSSATNIMTFNGATYRSAEIFITLTDAGNTEYAAMKGTVVHNGTTAFVTVYGITNTGDTDLATITAAYNSGTIEVKAQSTGGQTAAQVQYSLSA